MNTAPNLQPQQLFPAPNASVIPSMPQVPSSMNIFGFTLSKTQLYILGAILLLIVGYFLWRWYKSRESFDQDDDQDQTTDDKETHE